MCWFCLVWGKPRNHRRLAHRRKLRAAGIGVKVQGSKNSRKAWKNGPCGPDCMCDHHEGVTDRKMSRAVAKTKSRREIKEQLQ